MNPIFNGICKNLFSSITIHRLMASMSKSKPKVFITRPDIPPEALALLEERCEITKWNEESVVPNKKFQELGKGADAIFCLSQNRIDADLLDAVGPQLKVVGTMSVGVDHVDLDEIRKRNIRLGYTPHVLTDATAETTVILALMAARRVYEFREELYGGTWSKDAGPLHGCGYGPSGATVGIFDLGRIGRATMDRLRPFNVKRFIYAGRTNKDDVLDAEFVDLDTLCKESDFIIVTCALTPETKEIFNERAFSLMKTNAIFVNSGRGGTVQQDALISALKTGKIYAAGLDVMTPEPLPPCHELAQLKNCTLLPHIGSTTIQARTAMGVLAAKNIIAALDGLPMPESLN